VWLDSPTTSVDNYSNLYASGTRDDSSVRRLLDATNVPHPDNFSRNAGGGPLASPILPPGVDSRTRLTRRRSHSDHGSFNAADFALLSSTPSFATIASTPGPASGPAVRVPRNTPAPSDGLSTDDELMHQHMPIVETDDLYSVTTACRDFSSMAKGQDR
jgi:hypothetical protein